MVEEPEDDGSSKASKACPNCAIGGTRRDDGAPFVDDPNSGVGDTWHKRNHGKHGQPDQPHPKGEATMASTAVINSMGLPTGPAPPPSSVADWIDQWKIRRSSKRGRAHRRCRIKSAAKDMRLRRHQNGLCGTQFKVNETCGGLRRQG